ncbi:MAG: universal stress protein [Paracoccaceae bacterium]
MYKHILVPISFDGERDIDGPLKLASMLGAENAHITLLHVVEYIPPYAISYMPADYLTEARKAISAKLQELATRIKGARAVLIEGHSGRSILDWAETNDTDLIVLSSHRPGMQDLLLGSTASQVVRHASCSVHVMR